MLHPSSRPVRLSPAILYLAALCSFATAQEPTAEKAKPVFEDGQAQAVDAFKNQGDWIREECWVETTFDSDGDGKPDRMHVLITRQKQTETEGLKVPVIYSTSPYSAGMGQANRVSRDSILMKYFWDPNQELGGSSPVREEMPAIAFGRHAAQDPLAQSWVPRGFATVHSNSPGTGKSQGCPTCGGENESLAPKAVIDWLNGRAPGYTTVDGMEKVEAKWCTGKVGMTGASYEGTLPIAAATTGVAGLEVIVPIAPNTSYYHYYRSNGLVRHPGGYMGEDIDVLYEFINSGNPERREYCNTKVRDELLKGQQDRKSGDLNPFWESRDYVLQLGKWQAATLLVHGFNDWNVMPDHTVRLYEALQKRGVPSMVCLHQGGHGGGGMPPGLMNRWFSHYLYGVDNGVDKGPRAWIVREGAPPSRPTSYENYPVPGSAMVTLYPQVGGNEIGMLTTARKPDQKTEKLVDDVAVTGRELGNAAKSEHRLLYATPELKEPVHISGTAKVTIKLAADKPAVNLSVWLVPLPWPARSEAITRGWADPQNAASLKTSKPLVPGEFVELTFDLQPDDQIVPAGSRIGFMVFCSDHDYTLWPKPGAQLTVDLDATKLELPVVGGAAAFASAIADKGEKK